MSKRWDASPTITSGSALETIDPFYNAKGIEFHQLDLTQIHMLILCFRRSFYFTTLLVILETQWQFPLEAQQLQPFAARLRNQTFFMCLKQVPWYSGLEVYGFLLHHALSWCHIPSLMCGLLTFLMGIFTPFSRSKMEARYYQCTSLRSLAVFDIPPARPFLI